MPGMRRTLLAIVVLGLLVAAAPARAASPTLEAGVGKADITPKLGYYLGGWTRADRIAGGQHTRLFARTVVLKRGDKKVALVSIDLFMVPGGMVKQIGDRLAARGFSEQNILISASHTHSGPGGYANFPTLNTAAPSMGTILDPSSFQEFFNPQPADPELYRFVFEQITKSIERADRDLAPAAAGWGSSRIVGLTVNRSLEAHLANHGIVHDYGQGRVEEDPGGYEHTIDPNVDVLRVDKIVKRKGRTVRVPIGGW
jgi:neutral ceramidase